MFGVNVVETKIPVPWGYVSAKVWGDAKDVPVLVFHGIMDNAGSFDHLIPLLPKPFYYICVDLPGHGLSSHFPAHITIHTLNYLIVFKVIADYFKRERYIIMGHSYGGQLGMAFTQLYPQYVEKLVLLDTIALLPILTMNFKTHLAERFDNFVLLEEKLYAGNNVPDYTYDEALDKIQFSRYTPVTTEAAMALSHRALTLTENGRYRFNLDQRIKNSINPLRDFRYVIETLKEDRIKCPVLIILAKKSQVQQKYMRPILNHLKKMKNVTIKMVEGDHDVHNESAEIVSALVYPFLSRKKGKL